MNAPIQTPPYHCHPKYNINKSNGNQMQYPSNPIAKPCYMNGNNNQSNQYTNCHDANIKSTYSHPNDINYIPLLSSGTDSEDEPIIKPTKYTNNNNVDHTLTNLDAYSFSITQPTTNISESNPEAELWQNCSNNLCE